MASFLEPYIANGLINISSQELIDLSQRNGGRRVIIDELVKLIREGVLAYPLKKHFMTPPSVLSRNKTQAQFVQKPYIDDMVKRFPFLKNETRKYQGKEIALLFYNSDYEKLDIMSDYFSETVRSECSVRGKSSPVTAYATFAPNIAEFAFNRSLQRRTPLDTRALSDALFEVEIGNDRARSFRIKSCTTFKISVAMAIYNAFRPRVVYDPSAGWGDRLCAAALSETVEVYVGTDPNLTMQGPYEQMMSTLSAYTAKSLQVYDRPAEDIDLEAIFGKPGEATNYDFILNSPPYFNYEIYSNAQSQSAVRFREYKKWLEEWFFAVTLKNWTYLKQGGHLVYHLGHVPDTPIIAPIIKYMETIADAEFLGQIPLLNANNDEHRPIFLYVWRKHIRPELIVEAPKVVFTLPYAFDVPRYSYPKMNVIAEMQRFVLMQKLTNGITSEIAKLFKNPPRTIRRGVERHLAELIMNQWSTYAWVNRDRRGKNGKRRISGDEPFFMPPTDNEIELFFSDLEYRVNKQRVERGSKDVVKLSPKKFNITAFFDYSIAMMARGWRDVKYDVVGEHAIYKVVPDGETHSIFQLSFLSDYFSDASYIEILTKALPPFLRISNDDLNMLRARFTGKDIADEHILAVLIRYAALNAGSHQYILDMNYKALLKARFGANFECFASALNVTYDGWCSLFPDLEHVFGSNGNFVALNMKSGFYQANPPYNEMALLRMYDKVADMMLEPGPIVYTLSIPYRADNPLRDRIENEKLYVATVNKKENFHVTLDRAQTVSIPEYHHYIFINGAGKNAIGEAGVKELIRVISEYKQ